MRSILIVDNSSYVTGANKSIAGFTKALSAKYTFHWAVTNSISEADLTAVIGSQSYDRLEFVEVSRNLAALVKYFPRLLQNTRKLAKIVDENQIEIVHINDLYNMCGVALKVLRRDIEVVYHVRLLRDSYISKFYDIFLAAIKRRADAILCCSQAVSRDVGFSPIEKEVIYDSTSFSDKNEARPVRPSVEKIIYVGNVLPGKGHALALKTLAHVKNELPDIKLHFVGKFDHNEASRTFKKLLDELIIANALERNVIFDGFISDIDEEIKTADIVLNLSESESFSMVCLETLKAGVPLIASDSGGPSELFEHLRSGWLVPNRDTLAAAVAVTSLAKDYDLRQKFSIEGLRYARRKFNIAENAKRLDLVYARLLN